VTIQADQLVIANLPHNDNTEFFTYQVIFEHFKIK